MICRTLAGTQSAPNTRRVIIGLSAGTSSLSQLLHLVAREVFFLIHCAMEGTTVGDLLQEQPTNYAYKPGYISATDKSWAKKYEPITAVIIHSRREADGSVWANFDGPFLPEFADDELRKSQPANRPNTRQWRLDTEADGESWFHNEVSNVVLAAWAEYPSILQTSHAKPLSEEAIPEVVDTTYSIKRKPLRLPMLIGEMKRNLIREDEWGRGKIESKSQVKLSQELRG